MKKENFNRFKTERIAKKKVYYESLYMECDMGSKIRKLIQEDNVRIITNLKKYISNIYEKDPTGGALHICLDDLNLQDQHIIYCLKETIPQIKDPYWNAQYYYCAICLLMLSYSKRIKIVKNFKNNKKNKA